MVHLKLVVITLFVISAMMTREVVAFLFVLSLVSCMEMRETVERMVMVRTTGSDLQPAATGYIYKKESDGPASVVKLRESEIMEELSKLYKKPESFIAPIPAAAGPFAKDDEVKAASQEKEHVIPVVENTEEHDHIDGIADDDYTKAFKDYKAEFGDYNSDFSDYLHGLGHFDHGIYHGFDGDEKDFGSKGFSDNGGKGYKGYGGKHYKEKEGAGDYHTKQYKSFSISGEGGHKKEYDGADTHGRHSGHEGHHKGGDHGHKQAHSESEEVDGYHKVFNKNEYKKEHDDQDGKKLEGDFSKHSDGHAYHRSGAGKFNKGDKKESGHDEGYFGKSGVHEQKSGEQHGAEHSGEEGENSFHHGEGEFSSKGGKSKSVSYGFGVKH